MPLEGSLQEIGIHDVLQLLELARKTGVLTVRSDRLADEALVHVDEGAVVFAVRRQSMRRLGQQLLRAGQLTARELDRALALQRQHPKQRLGEILLEMGSVDEAELERQLRFQLEETIYDLMGWQEGQFRFEETSDLPRGRVAVRVRTESLIMEGARRVDEWGRLESKIPSLEAIPVLAPADEREAPPLELSGEEWEVLAEVDGERDLRQIAAHLGRSSFEIAEIVYRLVSAGVVRVQQHPVEHPEERLGAAMREIETLLEAGDAEAAGRLADELDAAYPDHPGIALLAGRVLAAQGRLRAATEAFGRATELEPGSAEAHYHLGFAAVRTGELDRAAQAWHTFLRLAPKGQRPRSVTRALAAVEELTQILARAPG